MLEEIGKRIKNIYEHLGDHISKEIFTNRLMYTITGDYAFIESVVKTDKDGRDFYERTPEEAYIYSCGYYGELIKQAIPSRFIAFSDSDQSKWGTTFQGLPVLPPERLPKDAYVYIGNRYFHQEIADALVKNGHRPDRLIDLGDCLYRMEKRQYFDLPELALPDNVIFVDVGALDGRTSAFFAERTKNVYGKIICMEPDPESIRECRQTLEPLKNACICECGAYSRKTRLGFTHREGMASHIDESSPDTIAVDTIDHILEDESGPFYIKMDIEGAEKEALIGAEKTIREKKPQLAISIYHKKEDVLELPELVLQYRDDYRFYLRHYHLMSQETVLYAI